jgi:dolichol-phosphate mannosyltransferase
VWRNKTLSVVLPTYNEKDSIAECIRGFEALAEVDEIIVVNNNAAPGTSEEVATTGAREVLEPTQGYGAAIRRGILEARTVATFIWDGANMGWFLRWGNWAVAKLVEMLYNTTSLSDVGCTFRVMTSEHGKRVLARSTMNGSAFGLEMLLISAVLRVNMVQVPVNYHPRVGVSSVTGDLRKTLSLGFAMIGHVFRMRLRSGSARVSATSPHRGTRPAPDSRTR